MAARPLGRAIWQERYLAARGSHVPLRESEEVLHALKSVDYPATKDQLLRAAQAAGASEEVIRALRAIPPVEYTGREELARSVPTDPAEDRNLSPAQRAEAARLARLRAKTHLSQYMLDVPKPPIEDELDR